MLFLAEVVAVVPVGQVEMMVLLLVVGTEEQEVVVRQPEQQVGRLVRAQGLVV